MRQLHLFFIVFLVLLHSFVPSGGSILSVKVSTTFQMASTYIRETIMVRVIDGKLFMVSSAVDLSFRFWIGKDGKRR